MNIQEMKEKRNRLVAEASSLVKTEMNAETRAKIDTIYADADAIKGDIERAERAEAMEAELRSSTPLPASPVGNGKDSEERIAAEKAAAHKEAYRKALDSYIRKDVSELTGEERAILRSGKIEARAQSGATGGAGGYTIATDLAKEIEVGLKYFGGMRQVSHQITTSGFGNLDWPTLNDTANPGKRLNATSVPGTVDELDLTFGQVVLSSYTYTTQQISIQNELLQDSAFNLEDFIKQAFVTRIGRAQNTDFTVGTGSSQPNGVVTAATTGITAATGGTTAITYNNLVDLTHSVDIAYRPNAKFMFNDLTLAAIRKLTDSYGRPMLGLGINGGDPDSILGYKYVVNNDIATMAANAKSALFGDFSKYIIRDIANSMSIMKLTELGALQNQTIFVGFTRADGALTDPGTHPVRTFVNAAS